jgi:hypothetical protein
MPLTPSEWNTASLEIPDVFQNILNVAEPTITFLTNTLNVAVTTLNLIKSFASIALDPLQAILEALIADLENLLSDVGNLGIYLAGDWGLLSPPFEDLKGGYAAYEQRMVSRFLDKSDPTRPTFDVDSQVAAVFFYSSADISAIDQVLSFVRKVAKTFKQDPVQKSLPIPTNLRAEVADASTIFVTPSEFYRKKPTGTPDKVRLTWTPTSSSNKDERFFPSLYQPAGYLVEVSTIKDGLNLYFERPLPKARKQKGAEVKERGRILDSTGSPLTIYGGEEVLDLDQNLEYNRYVDSNGNLGEGKKRAYGLRPDRNKNNKVPLEELSILESDGSRTPLLQKAFVTSDPEIELDRKQLPKEVVWEEKAGKLVRNDKSLQEATDFYFRVSTLSSKAVQDGDFVYDLDLTKFNAPGKPVVVNAKDGSVVLTDKSQPSKELLVPVPSTRTKTAIQAIQTALAVVLLSRSDFEVSSSFKENSAKSKTGLEKLASILVPDMVDTSFFSWTGVSSSDARTSMKAYIENYTDKIFKKNGSNPSLEKYIVDNSQTLRTWKWSDSPLMAKRAKQEGADQFPTKTIWEALSAATNPLSDIGLSLNPYCIGVSEKIVERDFFRLNGGVVKNAESVYTVRETNFAKIPPLMDQKLYDLTIQQFPHLKTFIDRYKTTQQALDSSSPTNKTVWVLPEEYYEAGGDNAYQEYSGKFSPVVYFNDAVFGFTTEKPYEVHYCRSLLTEDLYKEALRVLTVATSSLTRPTSDGKWISASAQMGFPELDQLTKNVLSFAVSLQKGTQNLQKTIDASIEAVQTKILELQNLLSQIRSLLNTAFEFSLADVSTVYVTGKGVEDIVGEFLSADNKPNDGDQTYSAGVVLVAGLDPLSSLILDFFV